MGGGVSGASIVPQHLCIHKYMHIHVCVCVFVYLAGQCREFEDNHSLIKGAADITGIDKHHHSAFPGRPPLANKVALEQLSQLALPKRNKLLFRLSV